MVGPTVRHPLSRQRFTNGEIHNWYRTVWGYSDHLVGSLLDEFGGSRSRVLDPFCGTGTTLVECMKRGVDCAGIDANPASCFAAKAKTNWNLNPERLVELALTIQKGYDARLSTNDYKLDPTYRYLDQAGMLKRGWISEIPLKKALLLKHAVRDLNTDWRYKHALLLALLNTVVRFASNVRFGPELYCGKAKTDADVLGPFVDQVRRMASDLIAARLGPFSRAVVVQGDSRDCNGMLDDLGREKFSLVICSPPYPTEHDYTRNGRLELAFLEAVVDLQSLREIKRKMMRSHTKGIYANDDDASNVATSEAVQAIVREIDRKAESRTSGFERLYSKVAGEYFGGMARHFFSVTSLLKSDAMLAYVVGDQASYLQVPIPTATILSSLAEEAGYKVVEIRHWRNRQSSGTSQIIGENILILRYVGRNSRHAKNPGSRKSTGAPEQRPLPQPSKRAAGTR
jgi:SAM-dependent methyltransferase